VIILIGAVLLFGMSALWFGLPEVRFAAEQGRVARAQRQLASFMEAVEAYRVAYGTEPGETAKEITASLLGENVEGGIFLEISVDQTNAQGELMDPWGTAWEIWRVGEDRIEARSAGPNRRFGDHDDLIASRAAGLMPSRAVSSPP
jgi:hypothetical protein